MVSGPTVSALGDRDAVERLGLAERQGARPDGRDVVLPDRARGREQRLEACRGRTSERDLDSREGRLRWTCATMARGSTWRPRTSALATVRVSASSACKSGQRSRAACSPSNPRPVKERGCHRELAAVVSRNNLVMMAPDEPARPTRILLADDHTLVHAGSRRCWRILRSSSWWPRPVTRPRCPR